MSQSLQRILTNADDLCARLPEPRGFLIRTTAEDAVEAMSAELLGWRESLHAKRPEVPA
jgi:hypothetical protein